MPASIGYRDRGAERLVFVRPAAGTEAGGFPPTQGYGTQSRARVPGEGKTQFSEKVTGSRRAPKGGSHRPKDASVRRPTPTDALLTVGA
jgi:hypothetical protein